MTTEKIIRTAQRLLALAEAGATESERDLAAARLQKLLDDAGLTLDDIQAKPRYPYSFDYKTVFERRLLAQVIGKVTGNSTIRYTRGRGRRWWVDLTDDEARQVRELYGFYKRAWAEELETLFLAFISKNEIVSGNSDGREETLSPDEIEAARRLMNALRRRTSPGRQIESGE